MKSNEETLKVTPETANDQNKISIYETCLYGDCKAVFTLIYLYSANKTLGR